MKGTSDTLLHKAFEESNNSNTQSTFKTASTSSCWAKFIKAIESEGANIGKIKKENLHHILKSERKTSKKISLKFTLKMVSQQRAYLTKLPSLKIDKVAAIWLFNKIPMAGKYCPEHLGGHISEPHILENRAFTLFQTLNSNVNSLDEIVEEALKNNHTEALKKFRRWFHTIISPLIENAL